MLKSTSQDEQTEFDTIREEDHIRQVWTTIEQNLPEAFERLEKAVGGSASDGLHRLRAHFGGRQESPSTAGSSVELRKDFAKLIADVQKAQDKYRKVVDEGVIEEYREDDPRGFKSALRKDCPIISRTVNSRRRELLEWQQAYKRAKPQELLDVFANLLDFAGEYMERVASLRYEGLDTADELDLDDAEQEEVTIPGLIGMGIKSAVLHHLSPEFFPLRGRRDLYALYFLTGQATFGLPSKTSEFIMVNDEHEPRDGRNYRMDQNYWYPYGLFTLYSLRIYRALKAWCAARDVPFDDKYRYVYVHRVYEAICEHHGDDIRTMLGGDEDITPY
jgi:hypothetical protein